MFLTSPSLILINLFVFAGLLNRVQGGLSRRLNSIDVLASGPEEYKELCNADNAIFDTFVGIKDSHLMIVAKANQDFSSCPDLVLHSINYSEKEFMALKDSETEESLLYAIGTFTQAELISAYNQVEIKPALYDIVANNCATFVLDMMCYLGYLPSANLYDWVIQGLMANNASTESVVNGLAASSHLGDLPMVSSDANALQGKEHEVIADLVYYYAGKHQGTCIASKPTASSNAPTTTIIVKGDQDNTKYIVALVVENVVWMMVAAGCFVMGKRYMMAKSINSNMEGGATIKDIPDFS